jgi:hypothetical protein
VRLENHGCRSASAHTKRNTVRLRNNVEQMDVESAEEAVSHSMVVGYHW